MILEICAYSLESCLAAAAAGANRVELCASPYEGGTTPSAGLIQAVKEQTGLAVSVMIRPRGGDFCYSESELAVMRADIAMAKKLNADGIVLGMLHPDGRVNIEQTAALVQLAHPMQVTFHRAIDMTPNYAEALEAVIEAGCHRVLTSGQKNTAEEGFDKLQQIISQAKGRIEIMIGSGVNTRNASKFATLQPDALHFTAKSSRDSVMQFRQEGIAMGGLPAVPEYEIMYADVQKIQAMVAIFE